MIFKIIGYSYDLRKDNLAKIPEAMDVSANSNYDMGDKNQPPLDKIFTSTEGDGLKYHTYTDIGQFTLFPEHQRKRIMPSIMFGRYEEDEANKTQAFALQTREEGLRITNDLSRLTLPKERNVDYKNIAKMTNSDIKLDVLQDEQVFTAVF